MEYLPTRKHSIHGSYAFFTGWHIFVDVSEKNNDRFKLCRLVSVCSCWWLFRWRNPHAENGTETSTSMTGRRANYFVLEAQRNPTSYTWRYMRYKLYQWPCKWVTCFFLTPIRCIRGVMGPSFSLVFGPFWAHGNLACQACERLRSMWKANLALTMWCLALLVHLNLFVPIPTVFFFQVFWCLKWSLFGSVASSVIARFHVLGKHPSIQLRRGEVVLNWSSDVCNPSVAF